MLIHSPPMVNSSRVWYTGMVKGWCASVKQFVNINVPVPEEVLLSLRVNNEEFADQMKELTALMLFEKEKLSIGQAAAFAGMDEIDFIKFLGRHKISIFGSATEIAEDFANA